MCRLPDIHNLMHFTRTKRSKLSLVLQIIVFSNHPSSIGLGEYELNATVLLTNLSAKMLINERSIVTRSIFTLPLSLKAVFAIKQQQHNLYAI